MTSLWLICSSALVGGSLLAADVTGRVELKGVHAKDLSGVVIWLESPTSAQAPTRHATMKQTMRQKDKTFLPHILPITTGTTVDFPNLDPIFHNAFSSFDGKIFDVGLYAPGSSRSVRFDRPGIVRVFCNIHPAMSAVIVVVDAQSFAVSARNGTFTLADVPPGDYTVHVYHERATPATLAALTTPLKITRENRELPAIVISETGYLPAPHKNKYGQDYPDLVTYGNHAP